MLIELMEFISAAEIYTINEEVTGKRPMVRDRHLLRSAARRPFTHMFGADAYPTLVDKAAALLHSLAYHHLFVDGNKRTARVATLRFLQRNGNEIVWNEAEAYDFILEIAQGKHDVAAIARWMEPRIRPLG